MDDLRVWSAGEHKLVIHGPSGPLVTIDTAARTVEFHDGYTPEGAVRAFWEGLVGPEAWEQIIRAAIDEMERTE